MGNRTAGVDAGFYKLTSEADYAVAGGGDGAQSGRIFYDAGGDSFGDDRETLPDSSITGRGEPGHRQERQGASGTLAGEADYEGHSRLFSAIMGDTQTDGTGPYDNDFFWGADLPPFAMLRYMGGTSINYPGSAGTELTLEQSGGGPVKLTMGWASAYTGARADASSEDGSGDTALKIVQSHLDAFDVGGVDFAARVDKWKLRIAPGLRLDHYPGGITGRGRPTRMGFTIVELSYSYLWDDDYFPLAGGTGQLADFYDDAAPKVGRIRLLNAASSKQLILYMGAVKIAGPPPNVNEAGGQMIDVEGKASDAAIPFSTAGTFPVLATGGTGATDQEGPIGIRYSNTEDAAGVLA